MEIERIKMKAFEEKYGTDTYDWGVDDLGDCTAYSARKEAWKAALRWVSDMFYKGDNMTVIEGSIAEELEDK